MHRQIDYDKSPFLVIWEATQACDLVCIHCRASAQPERHTKELSTEEGKRLINETAEMGTPVFIISGGDPAKREDLCELVRYGKERGLRMGTIPAATSLLTEDLVKALKDAGLDQMAQSLDLPTAELHDQFRGVPGAYGKTMQAVEWAHKHDLHLQINSTVCGTSLPHMEKMAALVSSLGVVFWEVFFLVPVGRGEGLGGLTAEQCEEVFALLYEVQKKSPFLVKITEAPHFRRYAIQRQWAEAGKEGEAGKIRLPGELVRTEGPGRSMGLAPRGVNAGSGFVFVSHTGDIFPSGFLPVFGGNVRKAGLAKVYRESELFKKLRSPDLFKGICGYCEFREVCGGSRSRAWAVTGDYMESDPWCAYRPVPPA